MLNLIVWNVVKPMNARSNVSLYIHIYPHHKIQTSHHFHSLISNMFGVVVVVRTIYEVYKNQNVIRISLFSNWFSEKLQYFLFILRASILIHLQKYISIEQSAIVENGKTCCFFFLLILWSARTRNEKWCYNFDIKKMAHISGIFWDEY